ncbi:MAG: thioredoxin domain-containing protein [Azospirillaceae bacterium]|nr:thioredoxin domain-containing protein [Azospirillaceae bacterium]
MGRLSYRGMVMLGAALLSPALALAPASAFAQAATLAAPATAIPGVDMAVATAPRTLGRAGAPVVIEEFASLICPHCAHFEEAFLPRLKADFINTGQVQIIFHDTPSNQVAFKAHIALRCLPLNSYMDARSLVFSTQAQWLGAKDPAKALQDVLGMVGLSSATFDACINSRPLQDYVAGASQQAQELNIESTPTLIIRKGGAEVARVAGPHDYDALAAMLVKAGAKPPAKK